MKTISEQVKGITITREQLQAWAGQPMTDDEVDRLADCIPKSSIPDAVAAIVDAIKDAPLVGK